MDRKIRKEQFLQLQKFIQADSNEEHENGVDEDECNSSGCETVVFSEISNGGNMKNDGTLISSMENTVEEKCQEPCLSPLLEKDKNLQKEFDDVTASKKNHCIIDTKETFIDSSGDKCQCLHSSGNKKNVIGKCDLEVSLFTDNSSIESTPTNDDCQENNILEFKKSEVELSENQVTTLSDVDKNNFKCVNMVNYQSNILTAVNDSITESEKSIPYDSELDEGKRSNSFETGTNLSSTEHNSDKLEGNCSYEEKIQAAKIVIHTRNFREYCDHLISKDIDDTVHVLLEDLVRFQDRMHQKDPVKARMKRRLVFGIKEVKKYIKLKKLKCIIMATDIENVVTEGGLNDVLGAIKSSAADHHVPCIYALSRKCLGKVCHKPVPVSCIGVFNYEGSEVNFKKMLELQCESMNDYKEILSKIASELSDDVIHKLLWARKAAPETLHDMRTEILRKIFLSENIQIQEEISTNVEN
ncbi:uncharacterized protein LOC118197330 [Stegodyphus dumicola]|uniref:uncharacterized protein LOC118197330 n=1 Tax=Stegodyphus dumicola TaxID=202533 RepID=UPI0015A8407D|nr:uncharacterized protein LOC118197330 [Stegodyphus dumicola]